MSSTSLSPSSSAAASADSTSTPSSNSSSSPPIFVGFIGISVLSFCLVSLLVWRKLSRSGRGHPLASTPDPYAGRPQNVNDPATGRPEMFDAWMGEHASEGLQWEESMPFSVTILTPDAVRKGKAGKHHRGKREKESGEQDLRGSGLQVAVLVAMPSLLHAQSHAGHAASGSSLRHELAIGLIEMPWMKEERHSLKRNTL